MSNMYFKAGMWVTPFQLISKSFICFNCNKDVASDKGYAQKNTNSSITSSIYLCPHCYAPNCYDYNAQPIISVLSGRDIPNLPDSIESVFFEIKSCIKVKAYTASIMLMRKLLMNIAVDDGAQEGKNFIFYVDFLDSNGYVTRSSKHMLEQIRKHGNSANHKIEPKTKEEAEYFFKFIEMLLASNYEYVEKIK